MRLSRDAIRLERDAIRAQKEKVLRQRNRARAALREYKAKRGRTLRLKGLLSQFRKLPRALLSGPRELWSVKNSK